MALLALVLGLAFQGFAFAQEWTVDADDDWCLDSDWDDRYCEVRSLTLPAGWKQIAIDGEPNGGIRVEGWDRNTIAIRARVQVWADSEEEAQEITDRIEIVAKDGTIRATGPRQSRGRQGWEVSFDVAVPKKSNLALTTVNGGIHVEDVEGAIEFDAVNGGVHLEGLAGDVSGTTVNGGIHIELSGERWSGEGIDVRTENGGIAWLIPDDYSALVETGTRNGGVQADVDLTDDRDPPHRLSIELGDGGATLRAVTTNGGVSIQTL
jgi:hypothetical protein